MDILAAARVHGFCRYLPGCPSLALNSWHLIIHHGDAESTEISYIKLSELRVSVVNLIDDEH